MPDHIEIYATNIIPENAMSINTAVTRLGDYYLVTFSVYYNNKEKNENNTIREKVPNILHLYYVNNPIRIDKIIEDDMPTAYDGYVGGVDDNPLFYVYESMTLKLIEMRRIEHFTGSILCSIPAIRFKVEGVDNGS